jgi:hypothetical protein
MNVYVTVSPGVRGDLTDLRAVSYVEKFNECSWPIFDEFTSMFFNVAILHEDLSRPEKYNCTCAQNAKEFTCIHTLGVAMMRGILIPPNAAQVRLLGRKRRRGRKPQAAPAWEFMNFALDTPPQHPQQNNDIV